ncbi:Integrator complex subunit 7 [Podochytrium sp. JEL0797]|nr:Integrator complex subunit 7 [Podochytrium sp. JEL0797]
MDFENSAALAALTKGLQGAHSERQRAVLEATATLLGAAHLHAHDEKLANHALLMLADVWRECDNGLRIAIYKVFKLISPSLTQHKNNIAGIVKRVKVVTISNDPIARTLNLRLYGLLIHMIEDIQIHHSIIESLESTDPLEYNAAIFAIARSAKTSSFVMEIVQKIARISAKQGPATSTKLIRILSVMHRDNAAAQEARELCLRLISLNPPIETKLVIFRSLTLLSLHIPFQIPMQIRFLSSYLVPESSELIILACLDNLANIAESAAHHFQAADVKHFATIITNHSLSTTDKTLKCIYLLKTLSKTPRFARLLFSPSGEGYVSPVPVFQVISKAQKGSWEACEFFCLAMECFMDENRKGEAMESLSSLIRTKSDPKEIEILLRCFIKVACTGTTSSQFGTCLFSFLDRADGDPLSPSLHRSPVIEDFFNAVVPILSKLLPRIYLETMRDAKHVFDVHPSTKVDQVSGICSPKACFTFLFQALRFECDSGDTLSVTLPPTLVLNHWQLYQLAQSAMIGGHFLYANELMESCLSVTQSESTASWLHFLHTLSTAEHLLLTSTTPTSTPSLPTALHHLHTSSILLKSLTSRTTDPRAFANRFISLRIAYVEALQCLSACGVLSRSKGVEGIKRVREGVRELKRGFVDMDGQSEVWFEEWMGECEGIVGGGGGDVAMGEVGSLEMEVKRRRRGGGVPGYLFVVRPRVRVETRVVLGVVGGEEGEEVVVGGGGLARVAFVVEGNVVVEGNEWVKKGKMRYHQVALSIEPRSGAAFKSVTSARPLSLFESRVKDGFFETACSIGFSGPEVVQMGGPGKYKLIVENRVVDFEGNGWNVGVAGEVLLNVM